MYVNKAPGNQLINHSIYSQVQLELDPVYGVNANCPPNEYLTKVMNDEIQALCPIGFDNCLLDGMELLITGYRNSIIDFQLLPGMMILDNIIFEQSESYDFQLDLDEYINTDFDAILFMFARNNNKYYIKSFLLNNNNIISDNINQYEPIKDLPFRYISIDKIIDIEEYSERNINESFRYYPKLTINFNNNFNNEQYTYRDMFHIKYSNKQRIVNVVSGINRYSVQKLYTVNGTDIKVPRYNIIEEQLQTRLIDWYNQYYRNSVIKDLAFNRPKFQNFQIWKQITDRNS